jgi:hypothetical protein
MMRQIQFIAFGMFALLGAIALPGCGRSFAGGPVANPEAVAKIRHELESKSGAAAGGAETQAAAKATGWGTIKGRFVYEGTAPKPASITITKDAEVCGKHPLVNESLLVSEGGGIANVVLYARDRKIEVHPDFEASAKDKVTLDNRDCHFIPHVLAMRAGQTLEIKNSDPPPASHNTNAALASAPFNVIISPNSSIEKRIESAEPSPAVVTCNVHPWMKGYLVVQAHPYFAVSEKDGSFELKNVPAGVPVEFQVWHESSTANNGGVQVNRPDLKWQNSGRFTVTLESGQTLDLKDLKVPASALAAQ